MHKVLDESLGTDVPLSTECATALLFFTRPTLKVTVIAEFLLVLIVVVLSDSQFQRVGGSLMLSRGPLPIS